MTLDPIAQYQSDHDLLVTLNERMSNLVGHLQSVVASNQVLADDHEKRLRKVEQKAEAQESSSRTWRAALGIAVSVIIPAVGWLYLETFTYNATIDARIQKAINTSLTNFQLIGK